MKTFLFGLFLLLCVNCIYSSEFNLTLLKEGYDSLIRNKRLNTYVIRRELDTSLFECVRECLKTTRCQSINYAEKYPICELNYETEETHADKFQGEVGFVFGNINFFSPELAGSACSSISCPINSKCKENGGKSYCEISDCGMPPTVKGAAVTGTNQGIGIGNHRHYKCENSESISVCQRSGEWTAVQIKCSLADICINEGNGYMYDSFTDFCIKPYFLLRTFDKARDVCLAEGADLVIVDTEEKHDYLHAYICNSVSPSFWLGATDRDEEMKFKWVDNSTDQLRQSWTRFDGTDAGGRKADCVKYVCTQNLWEDTNCLFQKDFICEKRY